MLDSPSAGLLFGTQAIGTELGKPEQLIKQLIWVEEKGWGGNLPLPGHQCLILVFRRAGHNLHPSRVSAGASMQPTGDGKYQCYRQASEAKDPISVPVLMLVYL